MKNNTEAALHRQLPARVTAWLEGPRMPARAALLALLVGLPLLSIGMVLDDHYLRVAALRDPAFPYSDGHPLDVFRIFDGDPARILELKDRGIAAWWADPQMRIAFMRPLTALSHLFDFTVAPNAAWWMHLHSVVYYAIVSALAAVVFQAIVGSTLVAGLAAALFAVDATHGLTVGWIANRNQLVASLFALASFAIFLRHGTRAPSSLKNLALGPACLALGLLGGEAALSIGGYFAAYAIVLDERRPKARLYALTPYAIVSLGWFTLYRAGGYGASGADFYMDPVRDPLGYLAAVLQHVPILAMNELAGWPADLYMAVPAQSRWLFAGLAFLLALAVGAIVWPTVRRDPVARFFGLSGLLALLPVAAAVPSARLLLLPSVGLLGLAVRFVASVRAEGAAAARRERVYAGYFLLLHVVLTIPFFHVMARQLSPVQAAVEGLAGGLDGEPDLASARVLVVNAPQGSAMGYVSLVRHFSGRSVPYAVTALGLGTRGLTVARTAQRTLRLAQDAGFPVSTADGSSGWDPGTRVRLTGLTIEVVQVTAEGRPEVVDFLFDRALDHPSLRFKQWQGTTLVPFELPPVGGSRRIDANDPFKALFFERAGGAPPGRLESSAPTRHLVCLRGARPASSTSQGRHCT